LPVALSKDRSDDDILRKFFRKQDKVAKKKKHQKRSSVLLGIYGPLESSSNPLCTTLLLAMLERLV
jgi:hypothetical protein